MMELFRVFNLIIRFTVISSILVCLILLIRLLFGKRMNPGLKYRIWLLLVLRLLIPYAPQSPVSIYNLFPFIGYETPYVMDTYGVNTEFGKRTAAAPELPSDAGGSPAAAAVLPVLWVSGALGFCLYTCIVNIRFRLKLKYSSDIITDSEYTKLLLECGQKLGVRRKLQLIETAAVQTPALYGLLRPKLLLPVGGCRNYGPERLKYVFLHELIHMKQFDNCSGIPMGALQALYWFNPLIWLAFYMLRDDREKACDCRVLSYLRPEEYKKYGEAVIHVLQGYARAARPPAIAAMAGGGRGIRERILLIARYGENPGRRPVLALIGFLLLGSIVLTDSLPACASGGEIPARYYAGYSDRLMDKIDYPFVNDAGLTGQWQSVDFVKSIGDFTPGVRVYRDTLYLKELIFEKKGKTRISTVDFPLQEAPYMKWTNGLIIHLGDKTAAKYMIKEMGGDTFMFMEWKSGDCTIRKMKPSYYVLKKAE